MRVYIAGPYTHGDVALNVRAALEAANEIFSAGHFPFVPHLCHFWHLVFPRPYQEWIDFDREWLKQCEIFIRLPGVSQGADEEQQLAVHLGIPIYYSVKSFLENVGAMR